MAAYSSFHRAAPLLAAAISTLLQASPVLNTANPLFDPAQFRVTTFASGLDYPASMSRLNDGSLLVGTSVPNGSNSGGGYLNFYTGLGQLVRMTDVDANGVADGAGTVVASGLAGAITSVRTFGDIVAVATVGDGSNPNSPQAAIMFFRQGALPGTPYTSLGEVRFTYSVGVLPTIGLAVRDTPGQPGKFDLFFSLPGSSHEGGNSGAVTAAGLLAGVLTPGTGWQTTVTPASGSFGLSPLAQFASGIRTSAGIAFDSTGALLLTDNGYQSFSTGLEVSADELHRIAASSLGASTFLGYPGNYPDYTTGAFVGGAGQPAFTAFTPLPGVGESRGSAEVTQAPSNFPSALSQGYFVGFHGLWDEVGAANTVNPVYFVDSSTGQHSAFITAGQSGFGKIDGLLASGEGLYLADLFTVREFGASSGAIYLVTPDDGGDLSEVPEPSALLLGLAGLGLLYVRGSRPARSIFTPNPALRMHSPKNR